MKKLKLQRNFTTPEQSKRLLELGVPEWTADCFYKLDLYSFKTEMCFTKEDSLLYHYTPCWSVGRLIEIMNICSIHNIVSIYRTDRDITQIDIIIETIINRINGNSIDFSKLEEE